MSTPLTEIEPVGYIINGQYISVEELKAMTVKVVEIPEGHKVTFTSMKAIK